MKDKIIAWAEEARELYENSPDAYEDERSPMIVGDAFEGTTLEEFKKVASAALGYDVTQMSMEDIVVDELPWTLFSDTPSWE